MNKDVQATYEKTWESLYQRMRETLEQVGTETGFRKEGDYWIIDEPYGLNQHNVYFHDLNLLQPRIIKALQNLLSEFPAWEIFVTIAIRPEGKSWPDMGLIIRKHEIVDGLQRQYFPAEFQNVQYEGSRQGTDRD